jgi:hypothetical protein
LAFIKDKISVFISSKCGVESYDIVRAALKGLLENTGFITTYVFEEGVAASKTARDEYLNKLEDSHVVLFLIDNMDSEIPDGVMKEWMHSRKIGRKAIYLFLNDPSKEENEIQKELNGPNGSRYKVVNNLKDFIETGFISVMNDIVNIYNDYCKNRLINSMNQSSKEDYAQQNTRNLAYDGESLFNKQELSGYSKTANLLKNIILKRDEQVSADNELDEFSFTLLKYLIGEGEKSKINFSSIFNIVHDKHEGLIRDVIIKRWESIESYFQDDIEKSIQLLNDAVFQIEEFKGGKWIRDDILIDIRNHQYRIMNNSNQLFIPDAQKKLEENTHILFYPAIDRVQNNIHKEILKDINKFYVQSPFSTSIGSKIDFLLEEVAKSLNIAINNGSLTHILMTISLLKRIFQQYSRIFNEYPIKFQHFKFSILDQDYKNVKYICNHNGEILSSCSFEKINELYHLSDFFPVEGDRVKAKLILFKYLGYYLDDSDYNNIQDEISNIFNEWLYSNQIVGHWSYIFESIKSNIKRIDINIIFPFLLQIFKKKFARFYDDAFKLLEAIDWTQGAYHRGELKKLILELTENKDLKNSYSFQSLLVSLRKHFEEFGVLDTIIKEEWNEFYDSYKLEVLNLSLEENTQYIKNYVEGMKARNSNIGKNGVYSTYADSPYNIIKNIITYSNVSINKTLFTNLINTIKETLLNPKQYAKEKQDGIELLFTLKKLNDCDNDVNYNWDILNSELNNKQRQVLDVYQGIFEKDTELTVRLNLYLWFIANSAANDKELLLLFSTFNKEDAYHNIKLLKALNIFVTYYNQIGKKVPHDQIILHVILSKIRDVDFYVRFHAIDSLFLMIGHDHDEIIIMELSNLIEDPDYRVKFMIINNANKLKPIYKKSLEMIFEKAKIDNNYIVRKNVIV